MIVDTRKPWVEANFKETQISRMTPGLLAEVTFDGVPGRVFGGHVSAVGAGTGSAFSLLPAQNATGNWVKVTQRVPVRISLEDVPDGVILRTGMSASVSIDVAGRDSGGASDAKGG